MPSSPEFLAELRKAASHRSPVLINRAASLAGRYELRDLLPDLVLAFDRLCQATNKSDQDRGFGTRTTIVKTLIALDASFESERVFLAGTSIRGGLVDIDGNDQAAEIRAAAAMGLAHIHHRDTASRATDLLADSAPIARIGAVRALVSCAHPAAPLLLRLKLRIGDRSTDVLGELAAGLMQLDPADGLDLVRPLLSHADESVRGSVAFSIAGSRHPAAAELLKTAYKREPDPDVRKAILAATCSIRSGEVFSWLIEMVASASLETASNAVEALAPFRTDEQIRQRVFDAVKGRPERTLQNLVETEWR